MVKWALILFYSQGLCWRCSLSGLDLICRPAHPLKDAWWCSCLFSLLLHPFFQWNAWRLSWLSWISPSKIKEGGGWEEKKIVGLALLESSVSFNAVKPVFLLLHRLFLIILFPPVSHPSSPSLFPSPSFCFDFDFVFVSFSSPSPSSFSPVLLSPSLGEFGIREPCWCQTTTTLHVFQRETWNPGLSCAGSPHLVSSFSPDPPQLLPSSNHPSSHLL